MHLFPHHLVVEFWHVLCFNVMSWPVYVFFLLRTFVRCAGHIFLSSSLLFRHLFSCRLVSYTISYLMSCSLLCSDGFLNCIHVLLFCSLTFFHTLDFFSLSISFNSIDGSTEGLNTLMFLHCAVYYVSLCQLSFLSDCFPFRWLSLFHFRYCFPRPCDPRINSCMWIIFYLRMGGRMAG